MKYLLGLDNGGTVIKGAIFDLNGKQIAVASEKVELIIAKAGFTERKLEDIFNANIKVIQDCIMQSQVSCDLIVGVGITGHGKGLYLLDKEGNNLYQGIVSTDTRAGVYEKLWYENGTASKIYKKTFQKVLACQPVALLKWLKDNKGIVYDAIGHILSVKDYIRYRLTGEIYAEITDISGTNLLNLTTKNYDRELLKEFDIEEMFEKLPVLKGSTEVCGRITSEISKLTGLKEGTIVAGGMFDIDACALGVGITNEDYICVIGGTWSINEYIAKQPVLENKIAMNSIYSIDKYFLIEESSPTSAGNFEWFIRMFLQKEVFDCGGINLKFYNLIDDMVEKSSIEYSQTIFLPFLFANNEDFDLNCSIHNFDSKTTMGEMIRAVYEGIVFSHKTHLDKLLSSRQKPKAIRLAGGVAKSKVWAQMFADVFGFEVQTIQDKELGCHGAAIAAGIACNVYDDIETTTNMITSIENIYYPNLKNYQLYMQKYLNYQLYINKIKP